MISGVNLWGRKSLLFFRLERHPQVPGDKIFLAQAHGSGTTTAAGRFDTKSLQFGHHIEETVLYPVPHRQDV